MEAIAEGYSEGIALDTHGLPQRRQRPEPVPRPRQRPLHAAADGRDPAGHHARLGHHARADLGFTVREEMLPRELLYIADEAFFVGTAAEVTPIRSVDKITVGSGRRGPVTEALQQAFFDVINGEAPDRHGWLTYVYPGEPLQPVGGAPPARERARAERSSRREAGHSCTSTTC